MKLHKEFEFITYPYKVPHSVSKAKPKQREEDVKYIRLLSGCQTLSCRPLDHSTIPPEGLSNCPARFLQADSGNLTAHVFFYRARCKITRIFTSICEKEESIGLAKAKSYVVRPYRFLRLYNQKGRTSLPEFNVHSGGNEYESQ